MERKYDTKNERIMIEIALSPLRLVAPRGSQVSPRLLLAQVNQSSGRRWTSQSQHLIPVLVNDDNIPAVTVAPVHSSAAWSDFTHHLGSSRVSLYLGTLP